jgi:hypothetical protein
MFCATHDVLQSGRRWTTSCRTSATAARWPRGGKWRRPGRWP